MKYQNHDYEDEIDRIRARRQYKKQPGSQTKSVKTSAYAEDDFEIEDLEAKPVKRNTTPKKHHKKKQTHPSGVDSRK